MGGLRKELDLCSMFVGLWVWWAWWVICGHELDETHDKWGAISGFQRLDVGGLWQINGLSKEIEASVCGYGRSVDAMRCFICCWLQVYGSD